MQEKNSKLSRKKNGTRQVGNVSTVEIMKIHTWWHNMLARSARGLKSFQELHWDKPGWDE